MKELYVSACFPFSESDIHNLEPVKRIVCCFIPVLHEYLWYDLALLIVQALRLSAVRKSIKVHLGQGQNLIMSIQIYFKYKYTYENAGFCILCIDEFKILKFSNRLSNFSMIFAKKRHRRHTPPPHPQRPWTFLLDKIDMWRFPYKNYFKQLWTNFLRLFLQFSTFHYIIIGLSNNTNNRIRLNE